MSKTGFDSQGMILNGFKKIILQNGYVALKTPSRPHPFIANTILNFHFDYLITSLNNRTFQRHLLRVTTVGPTHLHHWPWISCPAVKLKMKFVKKK